jgi:hypothetical protein
VARGKVASALVTFVKADNLVPAFLPSASSEQLPGYEL